MLTTAEIRYITGNEGADITRLLLGDSGKKGDINVPLCIKCIQAREKMKVKAPLWYSEPSLVYPFSVSVEQGSSQATALFKQMIISQLLQENTTNPQSDGKIVTADLTGGMGIDSFFISRIAFHHHYFERNRELCNATEYNFRQLGADNISAYCTDITENGCEPLRHLKDEGISLLYIDPARRTQTGGKAILLQDYEPDVISLQEKLFAISRFILVKVSPMADIKLNLRHLPKTSAVYVVAVENECKELLFLLDREHCGGEPPIHCFNVVLFCNSVNINTKQNENFVNEENLKFKKPDNLKVINYDVVTIKEEEEATPVYATRIGKYLYEPNKALVKGGAYKLVSQRYGCGKLAPSTHLYTSDEVEICNFPGKRFIVEEVIPFNKRNLKEIASRYPKAALTARNFPIDTNALKKMSGIKDGGNRHIFAVTLADGEKVLVVTTPSHNTAQRIKTA